MQKADPNMPKSSEVLQLTYRCNLACRSCPQPLHEREISDEDSGKVLLALRNLQPEIRYLTISGGEPTLRPNLLGKTLDMLYRDFKSVSVQLLTNAVLLKKQTLCNKIVSLYPEGLLIAIPLYAGHVILHDAVTGVPGSFESTVQGVNNLLSLGARVDLRVIVTKLTAHELDRTSMFIAENLDHVDRVLFVSPELHGVAKDNERDVWIPLTDHALSLNSAIEILLDSNIAVNLYNYPLCCIPEHWWSLCADSISPWKKMFFDSCSDCSGIEYCSGFFACNEDVLHGQLHPML